MIFKRILKLLIFAMLFANCACDENNTQDVNNNSDTDFNTQAGTDSNTQAGTDSNTQTNTDSNTQTDTDSNTQTDTDTETETNMDSETSTDIDTESEIIAHSCTGLSVSSSTVCFPDLEINAGSSASMSVYLILPAGCTQVTQIHASLTALPAGITLTADQSFTPPECLMRTQTGFAHLTESASYGCPEYLYDGVVATIEFNADSTTVPGTYNLEINTFSIGDNATDTACRASSSNGDVSIAGTLVVK
ncbi:MAG: hypothetical protein JXR91_05435 [Deltaproteobacteria bacterium]|nr:hypothetical protein [Deltaproteobacteria bacterium]